MWSQYFVWDCQQINKNVLSTVFERDLENVTDTFDINFTVNEQKRGKFYSSVLGN